MLGKLIKYDMKSMSRAFIPMWILAPVVAMMLSFSIRGTIAWANSSAIGNMISVGNGLLMAIMVLLFVAAIIGLFVMTVMFVIQRFWNGLLKEEGYLMFTLPVKTWELIVSKALTATLVSSISIAVGVFSGVILAVLSTEEVVRTMAMWWEYVFSSIIKVGPMFWLNVVLSILLMILGTASNIYHTYAAMALGHLFQGHKVAGACVSYIVISVVFSIVGSIANAILSLFLPDDWMHYMISSSYSMVGRLGMIYLLYLLLCSTIQLIIYHVITERILSTRLNLE